MFNAQEKAQAVKFPNGIVQLSAGVLNLSGLCETSAHTSIRQALYDALYASSEVWKEAALWFAGLGGTNVGDRILVLVEARTHYDAMLAAFGPLLAATATSPEFAMADANFKKAQATLSGFDWSLLYANPNHDDVPGNPFDEHKTVVGPHGDWQKANLSLKEVSQKLIDPWRDFLTVYISVPVYVQGANHAMNEQMERYAKVIDRLARVWAMHIEVETPSDAAVISADVAATNGLRSRGFFRTLLQNELVFNNRTSAGKNFRGRSFALGIVENLQTIYFQEFIVPLARDPGNGKAWAQQLVIGGLHGRFHAGATEFWMMLDAWAQAAFGFYHPLPDPTKWRPVIPDGSNVPPQEPPPVNDVIPLGYFDAESAMIAAAKADAARIMAQLDQILASARNKEGTEL